MVDNGESELKNVDKNTVIDQINSVDSSVDKPNAGGDVSVAVAAAEETKNGQSVSIDEYNKLRKWFEEMMLRKDEEIDRLKKENLALLNSAVRNAERAVAPTDNSKLFGVNYERTQDKPE